MRGVLQRVTLAKVEVEGKVIASIGEGLLLLLGIHKEDNASKIDPFIEKILRLRIFSDAEGKMNCSLEEKKLELLVVSQFTLYGNCLSGARPGFSEAMPSLLAKEFYDLFLERLETRYRHVAFGKFGADMAVTLKNNGPVTLILDL